MSQQNVNELYNKICKTDFLNKKRKQNLIKARNRINLLRINMNNHNRLVNRNLEETFDNIYYNNSENNAENINRLINPNLEGIFDNLYINNTENNAFFA